MKNIMPAKAAVIAVLLLCAFGCAKEEPPSAPKAETRAYVASEGKVEAISEHEVEVGSEIDGRVREIYFDEGDKVEKGALIAVIENKDIQARLKETRADLKVAESKLREVASGSRPEEKAKARASLDGALAESENAAKEFARYEGLYKEGMVSASERDARERAYKTAKAKVKEAEEEKSLVEKGPKDETIKLHEDSVARAKASVEYLEQILEKTYIRAPISGTLIRKNFEKGETINQYMQTSLAAIADTGKIWINAEVDETDIGKLSLGDEATVTCDAFPGRIFEGEVKRISGYAGGRSFRPNNPEKNLDMKIVEVKIALEDKNTPLKLGMTVDVKISPSTGAGAPSKGAGAPSKGAGAVR